MKRPFFRWFRDISIAKKLYFTVGIMALLIAIELVVLFFSINTLSSVRAYVSGEGLWSKAQKDGLYQLFKYAHTHDEADYTKFRTFMRVNLGDHKTLIELSKSDPDFAIARQGFEEGRNFECARWIMRMASPEDRRRILGENNSSPKDTVKNAGGGSP